MNRTTTALALAAFALAAAFGATTAQASAANFNVSFVMKNVDPSSSVSMIRVTDPLPSTVTGLIAPPAAIARLSFDPNSGNATYSEALPTLTQPRQVSFVYAKAADGSAPCTFTIKMTRDSNPSPYLLHFTSSDSARCIVPGDARSSDGQFTSGVYELDWSST